MTDIDARIEELLDQLTSPYISKAKAQEIERKLEVLNRQKEQASH